MPAPSAAAPGSPAADETRKLGADGSPLRGPSDSKTDKFLAPGPSKDGGLAALEDEDEDESVKRKIARAALLAVIKSVAIHVASQIPGYVADAVRLGKEIWELLPENDVVVEDVAVEKRRNALALAPFLVNNEIRLHAGFQRSPKGFGRQLKQQQPQYGQRQQQQQQQAPRYESLQQQHQQQQPHQQQRAELQTRQQQHFQSLALGCVDLSGRPLVTRSTPPHHSGVRARHRAEQRAG
ncbi:hypothetical protein Emed_007285 [Eimeria media]